MATHSQALKNRRLRQKHRKMLDRVAKAAKKQRAANQTAADAGGSQAGAPQSSARNPMPAP